MGFTQTSSLEAVYDRRFLNIACNGGHRPPLNGKRVTRHLINHKGSSLLDALCQARHDGREFGRINRLRYVNLITGGTRSLVILFSRISRQSGSRDVATVFGRKASYFADERKAVFARHSQISNQHVGLPLAEIP